MNKCWCESQYVTCSRNCIESRAATPRSISVYRDWHKHKLQHRLFMITGTHPKNFINQQSVEVHYSHYNPAERTHFCNSRNKPTKSCWKWPVKLLQSDPCYTIKLLPVPNPSIPIPPLPLLAHRYNYWSRGQTTFSCVLDGEKHMKKTPFPPPKTHEKTVYRHDPITGLDSS